MNVRGFSCFMGLNLHGINTDNDWPSRHMAGNSTPCTKEHYIHDYLAAWLRLGGFHGTEIWGWGDT